MQTLTANGSDKTQSLGIKNLFSEFVNSKI